MWFKRHWPALLAVALQAGSLWKFLKWALDWRGRYDTLAATYHEIGGASAMIGYILDPPPWFYPFAFFVGLVLIWWDFRRNHKPVHIHHVEIREHMAIGASASPEVVCSPITGGEELDSWEKLYEEYEGPNGKELRLRFLPDTTDQASDALLLICFGYKYIKNIDSVRTKFVDSQIEYLLAHAPGSLSTTLGSGERDFSEMYIEEEFVERVALSEVGRYRLTTSGENEARELACDMIRRA